MRHHVELATPEDLAFMASVLGNSDERESGDEEPEVAVESMLEAFNASTQIWVARKIDGQPLVLWGAKPSRDDDQIGLLWMMSREEWESELTGLVALTQLVVSEMLVEFTQLENSVDASNEKALALLRQVGFRIYPAKKDERSGRDHCRTWIDASYASLSFVQPRRFAPN